MVHNDRANDGGCMLGYDPPRWLTQHIYITSDEEIKERDWFIRDGSIHKCFRVHKTDVEFLTSIDSVYCGSNTFWSKEFCKKIILTTDQDLDGVQAIDDEFLEWFVKNPSCEWVEVKRGKMKLNDDGEEYGFPDMSLYKITIPKEELKETIEEAAEKYSLELLEAKTIEPHEKTWIKSMFIHIAKKLG
jgi:hypothetical protein